jgi:hypothetical protein
MHILGKILAVLVIGGSIAGVILTTRALQIRNEWLAKVEDARGKYEATVGPLKTAKERVAELIHETDVAKYQWHPYWTENIVVQPNVIQVDPGNRATWKFGVAINGLGPVSGIKVDEVIHAFAPGDGTDSENPTASDYIGSFRVTAVIPTPPTITAETLWTVRNVDRADDPAFPGQTAWENPTTNKWGAGWRIRTALPDAGPANLVHYSQMLLKKDEHLTATKSYEASTLEQKSIADVQLAYRQNELHGDAGLANRDVPRHRIDGLVKAIADADENRNATLEEVDTLRHQLKKVYDEILELQTKNQELASDLPGADAVEAATAAKE